MRGFQTPLSLCDPAPLVSSCRGFEGFEPPDGPIKRRAERSGNSGPPCFGDVTGKSIIVSRAHLCGCVRRGAQVVFALHRHRHRFCRSGQRHPARPRWVGMHRRPHLWPVFTRQGADRPGPGSGGKRRAPKRVAPNQNHPVVAKGRRRAPTRYCAPPRAPPGAGACTSRDRGR